MSKIHLFTQTTHLNTLTLTSRDGLSMFPLKHENVHSKLNIKLNQTGPDPLCQSPNSRLLDKMHYVPPISISFSHNHCGVGSSQLFRPVLWILLTVTWLSSNILSSRVIKTLTHKSEQFTALYYPPSHSTVISHTQMFSQEENNANLGAACSIACF